MKAFATLIAFAGMLVLPTGAGAFDIRSPNPDWEFREQSQRLHVSAGARESMASAPRRSARAAPIRPRSSAVRYSDPRERDLRGHDY